MVHSEAYPYPLPFPTEEQLMQISSYSSLANALGTEPDHESQQGRRARSATCDTATNTRVIYFDGPPVSNPSYPYPARNVLNPGIYPASAPLLASNSRCSGNAITGPSENGDEKNLTRSLSRYDRLPQPFYMEPYQSGPEFPTIHFVRKGNQEVYTVGDLLSMKSMPELVTGDLPILMRSSERWIKIKLNWPGYSRYPFEKRIPVKRGAPLTRILLLMALAYHIEEFVRWIEREHVTVEPGHECWSVATWKRCVVVSLRHLTGSTWQPEIYYLRG